MKEMDPEKIAKSVYFCSNFVVFLLYFRIKYKLLEDFFNWLGFLLHGRIRTVMSYKYDTGNII